SPETKRLTISVIAGIASGAGPCSGSVSAERALALHVKLRHRPRGAVAVLRRRLEGARHPVPLVLPGDHAGLQPAEGAGEVAGHVLGPARGRNGKRDHPLNVSARL